MSGPAKVWVLHLAVLAALLGAGLLLPGYHSTNLARILVLATFAAGYNLAFGYTGLLSLGHAMFFATGMYAAGLPASALGLACRLRPSGRHGGGGADGAGGGGAGAAHGGCVLHDRHPDVRAGLRADHPLFQRLDRRG
ncbi:hypothetical protein MASR1M32_28240 [Rhodobacter sp.]